MMSVTLPAPNGTTIVTRWVGKFCADAGANAPKVAAANAAKPRQNMRSLVIAVLPKLSGYPIQWVAARWEAIKAGRQDRVYE